MIEWSSLNGGWLLQLTASDTLIMKQVVTEPGVFSKLTTVASGLVSIGILVLTAFLVPAAWNFRKSYKRANELMKKIENDINPIVRHASTVADNIDYVTTAIRTDIQQVSRTIETANERLNQALATSERRVRELNALLRVVQDEAEATFVSTASTVRGLRAGASAFQRSVDGDEDDDIDFYDEEVDDGDDHALPARGRQHTERGEAEPRIRSRERQRGIE